jgi:hypothetical protein
VVSVLVTGPKGRVFKPGRGDGFLRAIKIRKYKTGPNYCFLKRWSYSFLTLQFTLSIFWQLTIFYSHSRKMYHHGCSFYFCSCNSLRHVKEPCVAWLRCYVRRIVGNFSTPPWDTDRCLWCCQRALVDEWGVLELRWGSTISQKIAAVLGTLHSTLPSNSNQ